MEENDGIKIKTDMIYSIVMLIVIGCCYYEVFAIKKGFHAIKMGNG
ncbi:MAG: hypothetical protein V8S96_07650 [Lachnospiraceae bacterium]